MAHWHTDGVQYPSSGCCHTILHQFTHKTEFHIAANGKHCVIRRIMGIKPPAHIIRHHFFDMAEFLAYHRKPVRVRLIGHVAEGMLHVAIRAVETHLFEFLDNDALLHCQ